MTLEVITLDHLPKACKVHMAAFERVRNAAFLHQQLLARNAEFEYALIDATVVMSRRQLLSAVFRAAYAFVNGTLKTPNVHSEIVCSLSPSQNISDAYRRFGVSPSTKQLIVVKVVKSAEETPGSPTADEIWDHLKTHIEGESVELTNEALAVATDLSKIRKCYKLNGLKWLDGIADAAVQRREMELLILSSMALRGV